MSGKKNKKALVPERRFPAFRGAESWKLESFDDLYSFKSTNSLSRDKLNYKSGSIKNIHYGDIHTKFSTLFDIEQEEVPFINTDAEPENIKPDSYCVEGDLIFADASEDVDDIGKSIEVINLGGQKVLSGLHTLLARQKDKKLVIGFGGHLFKSSGIRAQIQKESQGAKVLGVSAGRLSDISLYYPQDKQEQQKIADCLSSLDGVIAAQAKKVETLKDYKKALMQSLFPREGQSIPELRFPGFKGEWKETKLSEILTPVLREVSKPNTSYMGLGVRSHGKGVFQKPDQEPEKNAMDYLYLVHKDDLVLSITFAWEGAIAIAGDEDHNGYVSHRFPTYTFDGVTSIPAFFRYIIVDKGFVYKLGLISPGGAGRNRVLNKNDFLKIVVLLPSLKEQKAIADCLSSVDEAISAEMQKLDTLREHKKGLMQQLFPTLDNMGER